MDNKPVYPHKDIPEGLLLLWRPNNKESYWCQAPECHKKYESRDGAKHHHKSAHPAVAKSCLHTGSRPLFSKEGQLAWDRARKRAAVAKHREKRKKGQMERGNHPDDDDDDGGKLFGGTGDCIGMSNENNSLPHGDHHGLAICPISERAMFYG